VFEYIFFIITTQKKEKEKV